MKGDEKCLGSGWLLHSVLHSSCPHCEEIWDSDEPPHGPDCDLVSFFLISCRLTLSWTAQHRRLGKGTV